MRFTSPSTPANDSSSSTRPGSGCTVSTSAPASSNWLPCGSPGGSVIMVATGQGLPGAPHQAVERPVGVSPRRWPSRGCAGAAGASGGNRTHETRKPSTSARRDPLLPSVTGTCPAPIGTPCAPALVAFVLRRSDRARRRLARGSIVRAARPDVEPRECKMSKLKSAVALSGAALMALAAPRPARRARRRCPATVAPSRPGCTAIPTCCSGEACSA